MGSLDASKFSAWTPDMNPIQHVWDCLHRRIAASNVQCGTRESLVDDRGMTPLADIRKLIYSFWSHCMEVIQAQDELTHYQADIYAMCKIANFRVVN